MFGRQARLPVDTLFLDGEEAENKNYSQYIKNLRSRIQKAHDIAAVSSGNSQVSQKKQYDRKARAAVLDVGDRVLVKVLSFEGRHKLADKWEEGVYLVVDKPNEDIAVYEVQLADKSGPIRKLHGNHLLPVNHLPSIESQLPVAAPRKLTPVKTPPTQHQVLVSLILSLKTW